MKRLFAATLLIVTTAIGCSGNSSSETSVAKSNAQKGSVPGTTQKNTDGKGVGPITDFAPGAIDQQEVAKGEEIFESKCALCHKFEERYVGPALAGITDRRKPEWILNMILNPEEMIKHDEDAKALFAEYLTPMANQNIAIEDAKALFAYIRSVDAVGTQ